MASTLVASSTTPQGTVTLTKNLSDADAARVLAWAKAQYGSSMTNSQAFQAMMTVIFNDLKVKILNYEREQARVTADASVGDLVLS